MEIKNDRRLIGLFVQDNYIQRKVNNIFSYFKNKTIFSFEIIDPNSKEKWYLLTFFSNNNDQIKKFRGKAIILNKKPNNVFFTINGLNSYFGGTPEENKNKKLNLDELGSNVLLTHSPDGVCKIVNLKMYKTYVNNYKREGVIEHE